MGYRVARSATFNWVALAVGIAVGFFLSPYIVRMLGADAYGVWVYINSTIAFMSLLDLGLRGTVTRFVARDYARSAHDSVSGVVSAIFWFRCLLGLTVLSVGILAAGPLAASIEMPPELLADARLAVMILAGSFAVSFSTGVFGGVLAALHRFDLLSSISICQTLLRALCVIWLLRAGHGVLALALLDFALVASVGLAQRGLVARIYPQLGLSFRLPDRPVLREVIGYSFYAYVINVCIQVIYYTDNILVGATLSATAVTSYAIGGGLVEYLRQVVSSLTVTFTPLASSMAAQGKQSELGALLLNGTRAALLIALPIGAGLLVRGDTFIGLWMGEQFAELSGQVAAVLVVAATVAIANNTSGGIALGLGRHKTVAFWAMGEAIANIVLSLLLVRRYGLIGVAWGTLLSGIVIHTLFWPRYISGIVGIPLASYLWQSWLRPLIAVVPFVYACAWVDRHWPAGGLILFFGQMLAIMPIYGITAALVFRKELLALPWETWMNGRYGGALSAVRRVARISGRS